MPFLNCKRCGKQFFVDPGMPLRDHCSDECSQATYVQPEVEEIRRGWWHWPVIFLVLCTITFLYWQNEIAVSSWAIVNAPFARSFAVDRLASHGTLALPEVVWGLEQPDGDVVRSYLDVLSRIDGVADAAEGEEIVRILREIFNAETTEKQMLEAVVRSLGRIHDDRIITILRQAISDPELAAPAIQAVHAAGVRALVPIVAEMVTDSTGRYSRLSQDVRMAAVRCLGDVVDEDLSALPALNQLIRDPELAVRDEAIKALGKIGHRWNEFRYALQQDLAETEKRIHDFGLKDRSLIVQTTARKTLKLFEDGKKRRE